MKKPMKSTTVATVRTTWNTTLLTVVLGVIYKWTGWKLAVEDVLLFVPVFAPLVAIFYRACRELGDQFPVLNRILFGVNQAPTYSVPDKGGVGKP